MSQSKQATNTPQTEVTCQNSLAKRFALWDDRKAKPASNDQH